MMRYRGLLVTIASGALILWLVVSGVQERNRDRALLTESHRVLMLLQSDEASRAARTQAGLAQIRGLLERQRIIVEEGEVRVIVVEASPSPSPSPTANPRPSRSPSPRPSPSPSPRPSPSPCLPILEC